MALDKENHGSANDNSTHRSDASIPLEEFKPSSEPETLGGGALVNAHANLGIDDGLLDDDNTNGKPRPTVPDAREPGEEPAIERERPEPKPVPRGRPQLPKPEMPIQPQDPSINNGINYTTKKNIAQGMMDIALLTANASQLRYVMRSPYWDVYHQVNIALISISIALQIIAGVLLIFISRYDYKRKEDRAITQNMNDTVVIFIFAITIVNIFIATFGVDDEKTTFLRWKQSADASSEPLSMPSEDPSLSFNRG